jgi:hypothetical protein
MDERIAPDKEKREWYEDEIWKRKVTQELPFSIIAEELGISQSTAHKYFRSAQKRHRPPSIEAERELMLRQIDERMYRVRQMEDGSNDEAVKAAAHELWLRYARRKADILGMDADKKFSIKHTVQSEFDAETEALMEQFDKEQEYVDKQRRARFDQEQARRGFRLA